MEEATSIIHPKTRNGTLFPYRRNADGKWEYFSSAQGCWKLSFTPADQTVPTYYNVLSYKDTWCEPIETKEP